MIARDLGGFLTRALVRRPLAFAVSTLQRRRIIWAMAVRSFQNRFIGTGFGAAWSLISPLAMVLIYWIVFSLGFKAKGPDGIPYAVYFMTAFLPWSFVSEALSISVGTVVANRHLVKKMVFPTEILPVVEILAATFAHLILFGFTILLLLAHGRIPNGWSVQVVYAYGCAAALSLAIGWLLAAVNVFHRDVAPTLATLLSFWFWLTPIAWSVDMLPARWERWLALNPMLHVVESYRDALLYGRPVWSDARQIAIFWMMVLGFGLCSGYVFRRLKPEFADMM